jgi:hypothetical protein
MKNSFLRRVISLAAAAAALLALASCGSGIKPIPRTEDEARVMGTCAGLEVGYDEIRYLALNTRADMAEEHGSDIWSDPAKAAEYRDELTRRVCASVCSDYRAVYAMADEYYVGGGEAMFAEKKIAEAVAASVDRVAEECGGKKAYKEALAEEYITDYLFRFYLTAEECATELMYILRTDLGLIASTPEEYDELLHSDSFIRTNHVYVSGLTEDRLALAESIRSQLLASQDPESELILLKSRYDSDFTLTTTHGAYFARYTSDYGDNYEKAAFALGPGQISEVVRGARGYYVIMRLPVENDWIDRNYEDFCDDIAGSQFNVMLAEVRERLVFEPNEAFRALDLTSIE